MPYPAAALSGADFQAGRIIDDGLFYNGEAMAAQEVQAFLEEKVPVCDAMGAQPYAGTTRAAYGTSRGYPPPYTCLKDYTETTTTKPVETGLCNGYVGGSQTAAEIIYQVGKSCGISQKVLLVLLQKEQSLVTDDWPWSIQYRSATAYGCPDTAPCDTEYYGFFNQVYNAARQFKRYTRDAELFNYKSGRDSYILYNPNAACGGTNVFIENNATAALYNYTPYQPNAAALANLYGSGDSCSAYGNRNFWRLYNDWFGSTLVSQPTFETVIAQYDQLAATTPKGQFASVGRSLTTAQRFYEKGNTIKALASLEQARSTTQLLVDAGKIPSVEAGQLIDSITSLMQSL